MLAISKGIVCGLHAVTVGDEWYFDYQVFPLVIELPFSQIIAL